MKGYTKLTQSEFDRIKSILEIKGIKTKQVADITMRSQATIGLIKRAHSFDEYKSIINSYFDKPKVQEVMPEVVVPESTPEPASTPTYTLYDDISVLIEEVRNTNKLLAVIVNNSQLNKKGWFK